MPAKCAAPGKQPHTLAVYVHWPWCLAKCPYCDFNAHVWDDIPSKDYLTCLQQQLVWTREMSGPRELVSVFFGGGTPSLMGADAIGSVLNKINDLWNITDTTEITVECNPTSSPASLFGELRLTGVNRISVGVQSTRPEWLAFLGRKHNVSQALASLEAAQAAIGNVNADLIFGLPEQDLGLWKTQLGEMANLGLAHLSCYQLTIEPQTKFFGAVKRGEWLPLDADRQADFLETTYITLAERGYEAYEISNFCRDGRRCVHNFHVWQYGDYAGVGAGAHGRLTRPDGTRVATQTTKHPRNYLAAMLEDPLHARRGPEKATKLTPITPQEAWKEALFAGLRLSEGIDVPAMDSHLGAKLHENVSGEAYEMMLRVGFLEKKGCRLRATPLGRPLLDSILAELLG